MGILYIVATPIGNVQDISFRAVEALQKVSVIACEDTRRTGLLLEQIKSLSCCMMGEGLTKPRFLSYYEQNELRRIPEIIALLKNGEDVALVSDAGTPLISDPGFKLVREAISQGIKVESIPGPSSILAALTVSGLPTDKFMFVGYLPKKPGHRKKLLEAIKESLEKINQTIIFFEAPHRVVKMLGEMQEVVGDQNVVIARELTKTYEEIRREKISESIVHFSKTPPKGEFVILFHL